MQSETLTSQHRNIASHRKVYVSSFAFWVNIMHVMSYMVRQLLRRCTYNVAVRILFLVFFSTAVGMGMY